MGYSTKTLSIGDHAPWFALSDQDETNVVLRDQAGQPSLWFFYANDDIAACQEVAIAFQHILPALTAAKVRLFGISLNPPKSRREFATQYQITFPLLSDTDQEVSRKYGVLQEKSSPHPVVTYHRTAFLLDINLRVVKIYDLGHLLPVIEEILEDIKTLLPQEDPRYITKPVSQAPVLMIPNVLSPEMCEKLIHLWDEGGNEESGSMRRIGNKTIGVLNYNHKIRRDHFIKDESLLKQLDILMRRRVFPEIKKIFNFEVTRREDYRIGCYDASRGGFFRPHRDNTTGGTAHRCFAMSLNLNSAEYEGGYLRFPEYGPHLYKPDAGSAVIFSCSMLHEATDITVGCRFVLLSFLYGEKEAEQRRIYESKAQNDYNKVLHFSQL